MRGDDWEEAREKRLSAILEPIVKAALDCQGGKAGLPVATVVKMLLHFEDDEICGMLSSPKELNSSVEAILEPSRETAPDPNRLEPSREAAGNASATVDNGAPMAEREVPSSHAFSSAQPELDRREPRPPTTGAEEDAVRCALCSVELAEHAICFGDGTVCCNAKWGGQELSCILQYARRTKQFSIALPDTAALVAKPLRCEFTGDCNIFNLGYVRSRAVNNETSLLICSREFASRGVTATTAKYALGQWEPMVHRGMLPVWLVADVRLKAGQAPPQQVEVLIAETMPKGLLALSPRYKSSQGYCETISRLAAAAAAASREAEALSEERVTVRWEVGEDGSHCAYFAAPSFSSNGVKERAVVAISLAASAGADSGDDVWQGEGPVVFVNQEYYGVLVKQSSGPLPRDAVKKFISTSYSCSLTWQSVAWDRMQTAIRFFRDDVTSTSLFIRSCMLGNPLPHLCSRVAVPSEEYISKFSLNDTQCAALRLSITSPLNIIQGPPGTGKTKTICALITCLAAQQDGLVLATAQSNQAADNIAVGIAAMSPTLKVIRFYSRRREAPAHMPPSVLFPHHRSILAASDFKELSDLEAVRLKVDLMGKDAVRYSELRDKSEQAALSIADVVVCTCSVAGDRRLASRRGKYQVMDEATQSTEAEAIVPLVNGVEHLTLVGDHKQLGPTQTTRALVRYGYYCSLFERFESLGYPRITLDRQYRMHPAISAFPTSEFYGGLLDDAVSAEDRTMGSVKFPWPKPAHPCFMLNVDASEEVGESSSSKLNRAEARVAVSLVKKLIEAGAPASAVAVITFYAAQLAFIKSLLAQEGIDVECLSTDSSQGREKEFVILSFVRAQGRGVGFLGDARRLNVALTRARCGLIMLGHVETLCSSPLLLKLLHHLVAKRSVFGGAVSSLPQLQAFSCAQLEERRDVALVVHHSPWKTTAPWEEEQSTIKLVFCPPLGSPPIVAAYLCPLTGLLAMCSTDESPARMVAQRRLTGFCGEHLNGHSLLIHPCMPFKVGRSLHFLVLLPYAPGTLVPSALEAPLRAWQRSQPGGQSDAAAIAKSTWFEGARSFYPPAPVARVLTAVGGGGKGGRGRGKGKLGGGAPVGRGGGRGGLPQRIVDSRLPFPPGLLTTGIPPSPPPSPPGSEAGDELQLEQREDDEYPKPKLKPRGARSKKQTYLRSLRPVAEKLPEGHRFVSRNIAPEDHAAVLTLETLDIKDAAARLKEYQQKRMEVLGKEMEIAKKDEEDIPSASPMFRARPVAVNIVGVFFIQRQQGGSAEHLQHQDTVIAPVVEGQPCPFLATCGRSESPYEALLRATRPWIAGRACELTIREELRKSVHEVRPTPFKWLLQSVNASGKHLSLQVAGRLCKLGALWCVRLPPSREFVAQLPPPSSLYAAKIDSNFTRRLMRPILQVATQAYCPLFAIVGNDGGPMAGTSNIFYPFEDVSPYSEDSKWLAISTVNAFSKKLQESRRWLAAAFSGLSAATLGVTLQATDATSPSTNSIQGAEQVLTQWAYLVTKEAIEDIDPTAEHKAILNRIDIKEDVMNGLCTKQKALTQDEKVDLSSKSYASFAAEPAMFDLIVQGRGKTKESRLLRDTAKRLEPNASCIRLFRNGSYLHIWLELHDSTTHSHYALGKQSAIEVHGDSLFPGYAMFDPHEIENRFFRMHSKMDAKGWHQHFEENGDKSVVVFDFTLHSAADNVIQPPIELLLNPPPVRGQQVERGDESDTEVEGETERNCTPPSNFNKPSEGSSSTRASEQQKESTNSAQGQFSFRAAKLAFEAKFPIPSRRESQAPLSSTAAALDLRDIDRKYTTASRSRPSVHPHLLTQDAEFNSGSPPRNIEQWHQEWRASPKFVQPTGNSQIFAFEVEVASDLACEYVLEASAVHLPHTAGRARALAAIPLEEESTEGATPIESFFTSETAMSDLPTKEAMSYSVGPTSSGGSKIPVRMLYRWRRLAFIWRSHIVGNFEGRHTVEYWRLANSGNYLALQQLCKARRFNKQYDGTLERSDIEPPLTRVGKSVEGMPQFDATRKISAFIRRYALPKAWFLPVRRLRCLYGMRAVLGQMATKEDLKRGAYELDRVVAFDKRSINSLLALEPLGGLCFGCGSPGGGAEAARQLGIQGVIIDHSTNLSDPIQHFARQSPTVTVFEGNALDPPTRKRALEKHPNLTHYFGSADSPECAPLCTIRHVNGELEVSGRQNLTATVSMLLKKYKENNEMFIIETTTGGSEIVRHLQECSFILVRELDFATPAHGGHFLITPKSCVLKLERSLVSSGNYLAANTCTGSSRPMPPLGYDSCPLKAPCCKGEVVAMFNSGYFGGYTREMLCNLLGFDVDHITSKQRLNNALPIPLGKWIAGKFACHCLRIRHNIPIVHYDDADQDARLQEWHQKLHSVVQRAPEELAKVAFGSFTAKFIVVPDCQESSIIVETGLRGPDFLSVDDVSCEGSSFIDNAIEAFDRKYPPLCQRSYKSHTVRFVCDAIGATPPVIYFAVSFTPDASVDSIKRGAKAALSQEETFYTDLTLFTDKGTALQIADVTSFGKEVQLSNYRSWHALALYIVSPLSPSSFDDLREVAVAKSTLINGIFGVVNQLYEKIETTALVRSVVVIQSYVRGNRIRARVKRAELRQKFGSPATIIQSYLRRYLTSRQISIRRRTGETQPRTLTIERLSNHKEDSERRAARIINKYLRRFLDDNSVARKKLAATILFRRVEEYWLRRLRQKVDVSPEMERELAVLPSKNARRKWFKERFPDKHVEMFTANECKVADRAVQLSLATAIDEGSVGSLGEEESKCHELDDPAALATMLSGTDNVARVVLPGGLMGPSISERFSAVCTAHDCTLVAPETELDLNLRTRFPYACPYSKRWPSSIKEVASADSRPTPGTILIRRPDSKKAPTFVNMFNRFYHGPPCGKTRVLRGLNSPPSDLKLDRLEWFQECLRELSAHCATFKSIAFPWMIGCSASEGGDWREHLGAIKGFAARHPEIQVTIVQPQAAAIKEALSHVQTAAKAGLDAMAFAAEERDPETRALVMAIAQELNALSIAPPPKPDGV